MKPLWMPMSLLVIFISFFLIDFLIAYLLQLRGINNEQLDFILLLMINTGVLYAISLYFLNSENPRWFNWAVTVILYELVEGIFIIRNHFPLMTKLLLVKIGILLKQQFNKLIQRFRSIE
jgi:hypothetical protein